MCRTGAPCAAMIPRPTIAWIGRAADLSAFAPGRGADSAGEQVAGLLSIFTQPYAFNADDIGALQQLMGNIRPSSDILRRPTLPKSRPFHDKGDASAAGAPGSHREAARGQGGNCRHRTSVARTKPRAHLIRSSAIQPSMI